MATVSHFPCLLLTNGGNDRNMCSLNSNIQLLRHVPEFIQVIHGLENQSAIMNVLSNIFHKCGTYVPLSASLLRQLLANAVQKPLDSGAQYDCVELLDHLLDICPSELFSFDTTIQYRFNIDGKATSCPSCQQLPAPIKESDKILKIAMPPLSSPLSLQDMVKRHFSPTTQVDGRKCSNCLQSNPNVPQLSSSEKTSLSTFPPFMFIQVLRMGYSKGKTIKRNNSVSLPLELFIDKQKYEIIGTISHMGTADAGHNRAYLRHGSNWYLCEDDKPSFMKLPIDDEFEQNYCLLLKKNSDNIPLQKQCHVVLQKLPSQCLNRITEREPYFRGKEAVETSEITSNDENQTSHEPPKAQETTQCKECKKSFLRLNLHLNKSQNCASKYDMQSIKKEMEDAKRQKNMERQREFRKRKNE